MQKLNKLVLNRLLDRVGECFTPETAKRIVALRADPVAQARIEHLADKNTEGKLKPQERQELETYVWAANFIAILQSKARVFLAKQSSR